MREDSALWWLMVLGGCLFGVFAIPVLAVGGFWLGLFLLPGLPLAVGVVALLRRAGPWRAHRPDWFSRSVMSGFIASAVMMAAFGIAFGVANLLGHLPPNPNGPHPYVSQVEMAAWLYNLGHNVLIDTSQRYLYVTAGSHLLIGLAAAAVYGRFVEQRIGGPNWMRGLAFAVVPWALSVLVFFPLVGAGLLGLSLGAGPLPLIGNTILHAVYGITLGAVYGPLGDRLPGDEWEDATEVADMQHAEAAAVNGLLLGLLFGLLAGVVSALLLRDTARGPAEANVLGLAVLGSVVGAFAGSFFGLPGGGTPHSPHTR